MSHRPTVPSQKFLSWVESYIEASAQGTPFPAIRELCRRWGLSASTVKRILKPFITRGTLCTATKNGTTVGLSRREDGSVQKPPESAVESIVRRYTKAILMGELRRADMLPAVKRVCLQFHTSARTVTAAYRELENLGYVIRAGKRFLVGDFRQLRTISAVGSLPFFYDDTASYGSLFSEGNLAAVFTSLEREANAYGAYFQPIPYSQLATTAREWLKPLKLPRGCMFSRVDKQRMSLIDEAVVQLFIDARRPAPRLVMECTTGGRSSLQTGTRFSAATIPGAIAHALCELCISQGRNELVFHFDPSRKKMFDFRAAIRLFAEVDRMDADIEYRVVVRPMEGVANATAFLNREPSAVVGRRFSYIESILSRYRPFKAESLMNCMEFTDTPIDAPEPGKRPLHVYADDRSAAEALAECSIRGIGVPAHATIVGLDNNPEFLELGISSYYIDWNRWGYLCAHTLLGDIAVEHSSHGFIRTPVVILNRRTTAGTRHSG